MHQNLRSNLGRLFFAGEATSTEYYGFLQGAWFEGRNTGAMIAGCLMGNQSDCGGEAYYGVLHGTTDEGQLTGMNGWEVTSFQTNGF